VSRRGISILAAVAAFAGLGALPASASAADTTWLCKPGQEPNPCRGSLETTVFESDGSSEVENPPNAKRPKIDCFYVYPTISDQPTINANLSIDPEQTAIARYQASRFSRRCRVFAPVYRQLTLASIFSATTEQELIAGAELAYSDVLAAWRDYLHHHNRGRGVVLIGHSQGASMLRYLVRSEIDGKSKLRRKLVSAMLIGANVTVEKGRRKGGDFNHVPACAKPKQFGCVIGFSTFNEPPPPDTLFGLPDSRLAAAFGFPTGDEFKVLCNNPASLRGGSAPLESLVPTEPFPGTLGLGLLLMFGGEPPTAPTPWVEPRDHYSGECVSSGGAHVLMVSSIDGAQKLIPSPNATWGLHLADVNLALGDLVRLVDSEAKAYLKARDGHR
jgi:hypothetical protein